MQLSRLFAILAVLAISSGCSTFRTSDFPIFVRLPASKECFEIKVMSGAEKRYSVAQCDAMAARSIMLTSESWKLLRGDIQSNCQHAKCKQIQGAADGLFLSLDQALQNIPMPKGAK